MTLDFTSLADSLDDGIAADLAWRGEGNCVGMASMMFFPSRGQDANPAKMVCAACPVKRPCLVDALTRKDRHGFGVNDFSIFGTMNGPGAASTAPALVRTCMEVRTMSDVTCSIPDCQNQVLARGWCRMHYLRCYKHGDPLFLKDRRGPSLTRRVPVEDRFWRRVDFSNPDGCWTWTGDKRNGYGSIQVEGERAYAHRVAFRLVFGYEPEAVCHRCDNPPCVRPDHLFGGTQSENIKDMWAKGRGSKPPIKRKKGAA